MRKTWWKEGIVYQIYPRSFNDSNGDGVGDLRGIIQKLDYIKSLGVDIVWLCPVYKSPNDDNGYDISDYRDIMDEFGTMADFDELLAGFKERGIRLVMDLVANHSSDEHKWFEESRKSKDNPYRDYYYWRKGKPGGGPPNNWKSFFNGSVWEYDEATEEYYLHLFTRKQPDLNWENPKVRQEIYDAMRYWFDKGVDGFRLDVISVISKNLDFPDSPKEDFTYMVNEYYANGPRIHEFLHEMHEKVLKDYDIMTVGEGPGIDLDSGPKYVGEDRQELHMIFHFGHMFIDFGPGGKYDPMNWNFRQFKKVFADWDRRLAETNGWGSIFLGNHDFSRIVSRFGNDGEYRAESAKLLCMLLFTLRGTVYVYQGEEIGMTNVAFPDISDYRDVETLNAWKAAEAAGKPMDRQLQLVHMQSRDNARTPMQWDSSAMAGFTDGEPWIGLNPNYSNINVAAQEEDQNSILNFYREMVQFRKAYTPLVYNDYRDLLPDHEQLFAYERKGEQNYLVVLNFSEQEVSADLPLYPNLKLTKSTYKGASEGLALRPWEGKIFTIA
ncbi:MAG: alpha-glucosidase [Cyclobacteriaceae bacterium]